MDPYSVGWKHGVFYRIYPRSFMDSTGDGIGDLPEPECGFFPAGCDPLAAVTPDYRIVNVAVRRRDPRSTLRFDQTLLKLRRGARPCTAM